jgi:hypothetical protein
MHEPVTVVPDNNFNLLALRRRQARMAEGGSVCGAGAVKKRNLRCYEAARQSGIW